MGKIDRALIIRRLENDLSKQYAETCIQSCEQHNLPYELIDAVEHVDCHTAFQQVGAFCVPHYKNTQGNCCCHASHIRSWKRIIEIDKPCIILEHDAIVKGDVTKIDIPDMAVTTFGHRVSKIDDYTPVGPAKRLVQIDKSVGVHACGLTPKTAQWLWDQARDVGISVGVDRYLMMKRASGLPLYVCEPEQVVCWVRTSTSNMQKTIKYKNGGRPCVTNYPCSFSKYWKRGFRNR